MENKNKDLKINTDWNAYKKLRLNQSENNSIKKQIARNNLYKFFSPDTAARLKYIMKERKLRQVDVLELCKPLCDKYGVPIRKNDLSQYVSGKVKPNQKRLYILAKALHVSEAWLMGFNVPMQRLPKKPKSNTLDQLKNFQNFLAELDNNENLNKDYILNLVATYFSKDAVTLIKSWTKLDKIDQSKIIERIDTLLEQDKYQVKENKVNDIQNKDQKQAIADNSSQKCDNDNSDNEFNGSINPMDLIDMID